MGKIRFKDYLIDYLDYNNINNKDFANRIGITPKHLIDILSGESDLSAGVVNNISMVTNISADYIYKIEANYKLDLNIENYLKENKITETKFLNRFKYNYLIKEKYIDFVDSSDKLENIKDLIKFLRVSSLEKIYELETEAFYKSNNDRTELLLLWLEKCYRETLKQKVKEYKSDNINTLVDFILECAKKEIFNERNLVKKFNENGIFLVIQNDIPGSKIRGAFKVHKVTPAIYLTRKHQRIADIYFALLHELAHCKSDYNKAKSESIISYETKTNDIELKADYTAFNWMTPDQYYNEVCLKDNYNIDAEENYPKSFVLYRLAKDGYLKYSSKKYQQYNLLINLLEKK